MLHELSKLKKKKVKFTSTHSRGNTIYLKISKNLFINCLLCEAKFKDITEVALLYFVFSF